MVLNSTCKIPDSDDRCISWKQFASLLMHDTSAAVYLELVGAYISHLHNFARFSGGNLLVKEFQLEVYLLQQLLQHPNIIRCLVFWMQQRYLTCFCQCIHG